MCLTYFKCLLLSACYPGETADCLRLLDAILAEVAASSRGASSQSVCTIAYTMNAPAELEGITKGDVRVAFLPPVPVSDVVEKAKEGYLFPRKTTYFKPKVPAGLLM